MKNLHKNEKTAKGKNEKMRWNSAETKKPKTIFFFLPILFRSTRHRVMMSTGISAKTVIRYDQNVFFFCSKI